MYQLKYTFPTTTIAPENWWLGDVGRLLSFGRASCFGAMIVLGSVYMYLGCSPTQDAIVTRMTLITFLVLDSYKPSFVTVTGMGGIPSHIDCKTLTKRHSGWPKKNKKKTPGLSTFLKRDSWQSGSNSCFGFSQG